MNVNDINFAINARMEIYRLLAQVTLVRSVRLTIDNPISLAPSRSSCFLRSDQMDQSSLPVPFYIF